MSDQEPTMEERVLKMMRVVLIDVIKDTTTDPRLKHPLSSHTQEGIRDCLDLITARQAELAKAAGRPMDQRPYYVDDPKRPVVVPISGIRSSKSTTPADGKEPE